MGIPNISEEGFAVCKQRSSHMLLRTRAGNHIKDPQYGELNNKVGRWSSGKLAMYFARLVAEYFDGIFRPEFSWTSVGTRLAPIPADVMMSTAHMIHPNGRQPTIPYAAKGGSFLVPVGLVLTDANRKPSAPFRQA
jgi:hypothetical protein